MQYEKFIYCTIYVRLIHAKILIYGLNIFIAIKNTDYSKNKL
jgi:hypothetical protein